MAHDDISRIKLKVSEAFFRNGNLSAYHLRPAVIEDSGHSALVDSVNTLSPHARSFSEALWCLAHDQLTGAQCRVCSELPAFINYTKGYRSFCSSKCNRKYNNPADTMSAETKAIKNEKLKKHRRGMKFPENWRKNLSIAAQKPEVQKRKADTCEIRYGVRNPGVLGAYSSKAATDYILRYIEENAIDINRCMLKTEDTIEWFQMISVPWSSKQIYVSYDLVVFTTVEDKNNRRADAIEIALEYQGPWHYLEGQIEGGAGDLPATPYMNNRLTRKQQYEVDHLKAMKLREHSPNCEYLMYWANTGITLGYYK